MVQLMTDTSMKREINATTAVSKCPTGDTHEVAVLFKMKQPKDSATGRKSLHAA